MSHQQIEPILDLPSQHYREVAGAWIPLVEFALKMGQSVSTLRRHIKANKVTFKVEQGRYLLWDSHPRTVLETEVLELRRELQKLREEAAELKMLIALYEQDVTVQTIVLTSAEI